MGTSYQNTTTAYSAGSKMPWVVMEAIVTVEMSRTNLKAGEFYHVTHNKRPPGQCTRFVQWFHCLRDPKFNIQYTIPAAKGAISLNLDCDSTPFSPNEFGVYKENEDVGPEENESPWEPTSHESHDGK